MTYLIKSHHHDATPIKYSDIQAGDTIARPAKDTYTVGIAHHKGMRKWLTEEGETIATPGNRGIFRINRNHPKPNPDVDKLIIAYKITAGPDGAAHTSTRGWQLRWSPDGGYYPLDGQPIHGEDFFAVEEIHDWAPAQINLAD